MIRQVLDEEEEKDEEGVGGEWWKENERWYNEIERRKKSQPKRGCWIELVWIIVGRSSKEVRIAKYSSVNMYLFRLI